MTAPKNIPDSPIRPSKRGRRGPTEPGRGPLKDPTEPRNAPGSAFRERIARVSAVGGPVARACACSSFSFSSSANDTFLAGHRLQRSAIRGSDRSSKTSEPSAARISISCWPRFGSSRRGLSAGGPGPTRRCEGDDGAAVAATITGGFAGRGAVGSGRVRSSKTRAIGLSKYRGVLGGSPCSDCGFESLRLFGNDIFGKLSPAH